MSIYENTQKTNRRKPVRCSFLDAARQTCSNPKSSYHHQLCIGKAHCSSYQPPAGTKHSVKTKTTKSSSAAASKSIPEPVEPEIIIKPETLYNSNPDIVSYNDEVTLYCFEDEEDMQLIMKADMASMPPIQKECINMSVDHVFTLRDYQYKITHISKYNKN